MKVGKFYVQFMEILDDIRNYKIPSLQKFGKNSVWRKRITCMYLNQKFNIILPDTPEKKIVIRGLALNTEIVCVEGVPEG